jgi:hypothetical protein
LYYGLPFSFTFPSFVLLFWGELIEKRKSMYFLLVCADLYGEKLNLEITFPTMPTIGELQRKIIEVYNAEANVKRPQGYPAVEFSIARLQIYDDVMLKWTDLVACTQLHEYDQLYAFQPQSPWHIDVQKDLPPPRPPTSTARGGYDASFSSNAYQQQSYNNNSYSQPAASPVPATPGHGPVYQVANNKGGSPQTVQRLEDQRRREAALQAELQRMHEETARLEAQAAAEAEEERRRQAEEADRHLRQKEEDMRRQREALLRAEEEYRRMHEEAQYRHQTARR